MLFQKPVTGVVVHVHRERTNQASFTLTTQTHTYIHSHKSAQNKQKENLLYNKPKCIYVSVMMPIVNATVKLMVEKKKHYIIPEFKGYA